ETGETPQRLADIQRDVLSFTGAKLPQRRDGDRLGGQPERCHRPKPKRTGNDRILSVESERAAAIRSREPDILQDVVDTGVQIEVRAPLGMREHGLESRRQRIALRILLQQSRSRVSLQSRHEFSPTWLPPKSQFISGRAVAFAAGATSRRRRVDA